MTAESPRAERALHDTAMALTACLLVAAFAHGPGVVRNAIVVAAAGVALARVIGACAPAPKAVFVGALVLAIALPPATPIALCAIAGAVLALAGTAFGPPGVRARRVPVNPAMLALAVVLVLFAAELPAWPTTTPTFASAGAQVLGAPLDGTTGATALVGAARRTPLTYGEWREASGLIGTFGPHGTEWLAAALLLAGGWLAYRRALEPYPFVACVVGGLGGAALFYSGDSASGGLPPLLHLLAGGTALVATVVIAEPGSTPRSPRGRVLSGAFVGLGVVLVRELGGGVDRAAFVVLLANTLAPVFDAAARSLARRPA